jgi:isopropylmalate/homocitrate/citramalate synthase
MRVDICDVGPRDGLQSEAKTLSPALRAELCTRLASVGMRRIEAVSFANPARVPQMAGAEEVVAHLAPRSGVVYSGLVMNERGFDRAVASGLRDIHYTFPVTDEFARRNQNTTTAAAIETGRALAARAKAMGMRFTVVLAAVFGCPYEGAVDPDHVVRVADRVWENGAEEIVLGDSIGVGVPTQVRRLVTSLIGRGVTVGCHFHNTRNTGLANAVAAIESGCILLDASVGGVGGCPFAPRATGNIPTEDLVYMLHGMKIDTGIDLEGLIDVSRWLGAQLGKELPAMVSKAGAFAPVSG